MNTKLSELKSAVEKMTPGEWEAEINVYTWSHVRLFDDKGRIAKQVRDADATGIVVLKNTLTPAAIDAIGNLARIMERIATAELATSPKDTHPDHRHAGDLRRMAKVALAAFNKELGTP